MPDHHPAPGSDIRPWARPAPRGYLFTNANVIDVQKGNVLENARIVTRQGKIESVSSSAEASSSSDLTVIDCEGHYLCPGLFDAHVHLCAVPGFKDLSKAFGNSDHASLLRQPFVASQMLHRGFTSVRDCGGAQLPLKEAIDDVFPGPRLFISGHALSQFGGHGDLRSSHDQAECCGGLHSNNHLGRMCNGVPECMAAVREEIRCGADFIKIMGSGGVASPTDKLEHLQFTNAEIQAMVECAENAGTFVTAHAYTVKAIRHCIENGVKEFALRSQVLSPLEILQSATTNPAKMMGWEESIGQIKGGFQADIVFLNKNPLEDVTVFDRPEEHVLGVMKDGRVCKSRWSTLAEDSEIPVRVKYN